MNPSPDSGQKDANDFDKLKAEERRWQDEIGNDLIEQSYQCAGSRLVYEKQFERIISRIKAGENCSLLEIGCGRGQCLGKILESFDSAKMKLIGLDLSSGLIEMKQKYKNDVHWIIADGEDLPFADKVFDIVVYNGSLHHMPDFRKALLEAFRIIQTDGHVILYEPISTLFSKISHRLLDPFVFKKTKYESPVDESCKDNFRFEILHNIITDAGYTYTKSWHDFLAYPFTGCYAGSYFSKKAGFVKALMRVENVLERIALIRSICRFFCWRVLVDIYRNHDEYH
jgi:ubiquinone/menaquinone biosynthesis C-methylase UbiE